MYCPDIGPEGLTKTTRRWGSWYSDREPNRVYLEHTMVKRSQSTESVKYPASRTIRIVGAQHEANEAATGAEKQKTIIIFSKGTLTVNNATAPTLKNVHCVCSIVSLGNPAVTGCPCECRLFVP